MIDLSKFFLYLHISLGPPFFLNEVVNLSSYIFCICSEPFTRRPIHSTTYRANGPGPCTRQKNRVNGNEAHLLDERLRFGSAGSLTLVNGVMPPA